MGHKPGKTSAIIKSLLWCQFLIYEGWLLSFLGECSALRNMKSHTVGFLADSVLKFSTKNEIFIKHYKNGSVFHF